MSFVSVLRGQQSKSEVQILGIFRELIMIRVFPHSEHGGSHIFELTASAPSDEDEWSREEKGRVNLGKGSFCAEMRHHQEEYHS